MWSVDRLDDVLLRQVLERLQPVDPRRLLREVEALRLPDQVRLRGIGWKHRADVILLAVKPINEQHLHRTAAVPVALLVVRLDSTHARAEALGNDCREPRWGRGRNAHLPFRRR